MRNIVIMSIFKLEPINTGYVCKMLSNIFIQNKNEATNEAYFK